MSSNDQLWIIKDKDGLYSIYVDSCVDNPFDWREETPFKVVKTREEAEKIVAEVNAEYGEVWLDEDHARELMKNLGEMCKFDENGCAYVRFKPFRPNQVKFSMQVAMSMMVFNFDFDEKNGLIGLEILK